MNATNDFIILIALILVLFGTPIRFLWLGLKRINTSRPTGGKILIGIGTAILFIYLSAIIAYIVQVGPGRSGILTRGTSPRGLEYCVIQTFKGMTGPYRVSFYIRDANGLWRWNYLAHQDDAWRSATVEFSNGVAHISKNGVYRRDIPMPTNTVDLATVLPGCRDEYCPSNYTVEDILKYHTKNLNDSVKSHPKFTGSMSTASVTSSASASD